MGSHTDNGASAETSAAAKISSTSVLAGYARIAGWQLDLYRDLHRHPELGHQEVRTAGIVAEALRGIGFTVHERVGTTGVVGILHNGDGPVVLARADMDGLPVTEATGLPYASTDRATDRDGDEVPVMHACGHDAHVAALLGAAKLLAEDRSAWHGTCVALFQPAEELADGAETMLHGGLRDLIPRPDVAFAQHVLVGPAGTVGTRPGPFLSSGDSMRVTVHGRGSHGSMPHLSVDPVVLAASIVMRLQGIVAREVSPDEFAVLTVGKIAAGAKSNIIADHAVLELNIRTFDAGVRDRVLAAVHRIIEAECAASGSPTPPTFELYDQYPLTDNDAAVTDRVTAAFAAYFGGRARAIARWPASEDFSVLPDAFGTPYTYWGVGMVDPEFYARAQADDSVSTEIPANHSPGFAPDAELTLRTGTEALVVAALAWLSVGDSTVGHS